MATATPRSNGAGGARDWVRQTETAPYHEPVLCPPGGRARRRTRAPSTSFHARTRPLKRQKTPKATQPRQEPPAQR